MSEDTKQELHETVNSLIGEITDDEFDMFIIEILTSPYVREYWRERMDSEIAKLKEFELGSTSIVPRGVVLAVINKVFTDTGDKDE